jgi:Cys-tRNA(Pro) deacylase
VSGAKCGSNRKISTLRVLVLSTRMIETAVTRSLDEVGVRYQLKLHHEPVYTAAGAARERGVRLSQIAKSLVVKCTNKVVLAVVPGDRKLSLGKLARLLGEKNVRLADRQEARAATGYEIGSISPIGVSGIEVWVESGLLNEEYVDISSGRPDAGVELLSRDLLRVVHGKVADMCQTQ